MELEVLRISSGKDSTSGILFDITSERKFLCYTLEDEKRDEKIVDIFNKMYKLKGKMGSRYRRKYGISR